MVTVYFIAASVIIPLILLIRKPVVSHALVFIYVGFRCFVCVRVLPLRQPGRDFFKADALGCCYFCNPDHQFLLSHSLCRLCPKAVAGIRHRCCAQCFFVVFATAILRILSTHIGMLWAFLEASTLSGAALIYHDRDKLSLEATWKYLLLVLSVSPLGFAGIMFLSIAAHNTPTTSMTLLGGP